MDTAQLAAVAGSSRVTRSFAFLDLCGFTDFGDAHGDEAAVTEVQHLRAAVREVAPLFGVRVEKWLGDGVMIVGVDNEPLVAPVVAIEQRFRHHGQLSVRAGIATGAVLLVEGDDYIGRAVNVASRLCDGAAAGELLAAATPEDGDVGVLIAPMVKGNRELIAGLADDQTFGMTVMLGVGGVLAEAVADVSFRLVPISRVDAEDMIDDLATQRLLGPFRGEPAVDRERLVDVLVGLSDASVANPNLRSADLNPLIIVDGVPVAVDALVELRG